MAVKGTSPRTGLPEEERWAELAFRGDDIVISTPMKSGTTWAQMICAILVFQTPELPRPLPVLSPWVDDLRVPQDDMFADLAAQRHRRFLKTHTPLEHLSGADGVKFLVVGRDPLDRAVSLYHQIGNVVTPAESATPPLVEWLRAWCHADAPATGQQSDVDRMIRADFARTIWHLYGAWLRRDDPDVLLVRYEDLVADLAGQMRRIAAWLDIAVPEDVWPDLVEAATFDNMKKNAPALAPLVGDLKDPSAFFYRGTSGAARDCSPTTTSRPTGRWSRSWPGRSSSRGYTTS